VVGDQVGHIDGTGSGAGSGPAGSGPVGSDWGWGVTGSGTRGSGTTGSGGVGGCPGIGSIGSPGVGGVGKGSGTESIRCCINGPYPARGKFGTVGPIGAIPFVVLMTT
jgi:hypothetical protein